jgi:L-threonylcarbamoyladenylate synthase
VGIESTIVDCTRGVPVLLRPGAITRDRSPRPAAATALERRAARADPARLRHAGGPLRPNAKVRLMDAKALQPAWTCWAPRQRTWRCTRARRCAAHRPRPAAAHARRRRAAAQQLFAALRGFDDAGARLIWIETPPDTPTGKACATACSVPPRPEARRHATR